MRSNSKISEMKWVTEDGKVWNRRKQRASWALKNSVYYTRPRLHRRYVGVQYFVTTCKRR